MDLSLFTGLIDFKPTGVADVDKAVAHINGSLKNLGQAFGGSNLSKMLNVGKALGVNVTEGLTSAFTSVAPQLASILATPIVGQIAAGIAAVVALTAAGAGKQREYNRFDALTGGRGQTTRLFGSLREDFTGTDISVDSLKSLSKEMLAAGMTVDQITTRLRALGNVSLATGSSVQAMQKALERMELTGRVNNRTLMAFGVGFIKEMAAHRGMSVSQLRGEANSGILTAADMKAEVDRQGGAGSKGDQIRVKELNDVIGQMQIMGERILEPFKNLGVFVIETLQIGKVLGVVNGVLGVFGSAVKWVISAVAPVGELIGAVLAPAFDLIVAALKVTGWLLEGLGKVIGWILTPFKWLADGITWLVNAIAAAVNKIGWWLGWSTMESVQSPTKNAEKGDVGTTGFINLGNLAEKMQEAALKNNLDQEQLDQLKEVNKNLEAMRNDSGGGDYGGDGSEGSW